MIVHVDVHVHVNINVHAPDRRYGMTQMTPIVATLAQNRPVLHVPLATVPEPQQG